MGPLAFPGNGEERQRGNKLRGREEMVNQRENGFIEIGTGRLTRNLMVQLKDS